MHFNYSLPQSEHCYYDFSKSQFLNGIQNNKGNIINFYLF